MKILFCVNWRVDQGCTPEAAITRFAPDYRLPGQPYWFFRHLNHPPELDVMDVRVPFGTEKLELEITRCLVSQGLAAYVKSRRYDLVLSHGGQSGLTFALLQTLFRSKPVPHVLLDVSRITGTSNSPKLIRACRWALNSVAATITHSSHHLGFYREHFPKIAENATFIPLGVDLDDFAQRTCPVEDQIICVGYAKRDWRLLVDAYAGLRTKTKLVLLGIPESERIAQEGVECVPRVAIEEMRQWISRSRFLVLPLPPCDYCIGQQTFLQTMALGKAALVSDIPAALDYIEDGRNGFLYKAGDKEDLQRKLQYLLDSPERVKQVGRSARDYVARHCSESKMAESVLAVLEHALSLRESAFK